MKISYLSLVIIYFIINLFTEVTARYVADIDISELRYLVSLPVLGILVILCSRKFINYPALTTLVFAFTVLVFSLVISMATDIVVSGASSVKFIACIFLVLIGINLKTLNLNILYKLSIIITISIYLNLIIANIFGYGQQPYGQNSVYLGGGSVFQAYILVYNIILIFIVADEKKKIFLYILNFIPVLIIFRRGALFSALIIGIVYLTFMSKQQKLQYLAMAGVVLLIASFFIQDQVLNVYDTRMRDIEQDIEIQAGRFAELEMVSYALQNEGLFSLMFGIEPFNYVLYANTARHLHTDFSTILFSFGLIGFLFYCIFNVYLLIKIYRRLDLMWLIIYGAVFVLLSFSGQYYSIMSLSMYYFLVGLSLNEYIYKESMVYS